MPDPEDLTQGAVRKTLDDAVFTLGVHLAGLQSGQLADLRRMRPGDGTGAFWRVYYAPQVALDQQRGTAFDWEWVVHALALLTPTGNDQNKRSAHEGNLSPCRAARWHPMGGAAL